MIQADRFAVLISCSDHYSHRLGITDDCLKKLGYTTTYITSDFDHTAKEHFSCKVSGCVQIHALPYRKNLSIQRILSHQRFARDVFAYLESMQRQPDVIVALLPPNFLGHYAARYKRHHPNVKLIFDIFDLWPETFPSGRVKKLLKPVFHVWAKIRDRSLPAADLVITECDLFRQKLQLKSSRSATVYLSRPRPEFDHSDVNLQDDRLSLCYLGAINNVIGIADICRLISELSAKKPVVLHIIGKGEREQEFIDSANAAGAEVIFYGPVYDEEKLKDIMNRCHFGLNIMRASVCVGLTMKSVDYFRYGLPIINSIPADTKALVENEKIGYQLDEQCAQKVLSSTVADCLEMRSNVSAAFMKYFAQAVVSQRCLCMLEDLLR